MPRRFVSETNLCEITRRALAAARAGDLDALGQALSDRQAALATASPAELAAAFEDGQTIGGLLMECKRNIVHECGRLENAREGLASYGGVTSARTGVNVRG